MATPEDRIKELVRTGAIDETEASGLLSAVRPAAPPRAGASRNPFERWSGEVTTAAGVVVSLVSIALSRLGIRFDGALDVHVTRDPVPLATAAFDQALAFPLTAAVLWVVARAIHRHVRPIDVLGFVGFSRMPAVAGALVVKAIGPAVSPPDGRLTSALLAILFVGLATIGAHITLLVLGFRTASGARGGRLATAFVGALIGAEVVTKVLLALVH